ncbi:MULTISPECIES: hypothetical protein [unclassified Bradyrhizobium]|uniref:hypothetical protein n=1 Tax=unclassified Bradyrhizobium TaxID=2631580 RepID=UPI0012ECA8EE|nr:MULTISPECIES: hypothetical protein [unclassified Bradyrhizobium]MCP3461270.1 hypothetical protein [Bradyrhizobium sp. CCGUVB23]
MTDEFGLGATGDIAKRKKKPPTEATSVAPGKFSAQASKQAKRPTVAGIEYLDEKMKPGGTSRTRDLLAPSGLVARALI